MEPLFAPPPPLDRECGVRWRTAFGNVADQVRQFGFYRLTVPQFEHPERTAELTLEFLAGL